MHRVELWRGANGLDERLDAEQALLLAIRSGDDPSALERLLSLHEESVYSLCRSILGQAEDAEDAVQETFLRVLRTHAGYRGGCSVRTWITRIAVNVCLDRKRTRRPVASLHDDLIASQAVGSPESRVVQDASISEALAILLPRHRTMLLLKEMEGWTVAEIAIAFKCTQRRVYHELSIAHRMLAEWREQFEHEGE